MRLQVFLSHSRVCSRRRALVLVQEGHVRVNATIVREPSYDVDAEKDEVFLDTTRIGLKEKSYLMLHKPAGFVTTLEDSHARHIVIDLLPSAYRHLYPVGRLDKDSEGLLLFTNDGELTHRLLHPSFKVDKVYLVEINGCIDKESILRLEHGLLIDGRRTQPAKVELVYARPKQSRFTMTIHEGRKRQIRLMLAAIGYKVSRLKRIQYGPLRLGELSQGKWRLLSVQEIKHLKDICGIKNSVTVLKEG